jgi:hypothetical protein
MAKPRPVHVHFSERESSTLVAINNALLLLGIIEASINLINYLLSNARPARAVSASHDCATIS